MAKCKCKGCDKRTIKCHSTCKDYKKYKAQIEKEKESRRYDQIIVSNSWSYVRKGKRNAK